MLKKSTLREIKTSLARYLAIFAIVALGVGFFSGLRDCKASMVTYGIDDESVEMAKQAEGVSGAEGSVQVDVLAESGGGDEAALKAISLPENINTLRVVTGRLPEAADECVADDYHIDSEGYRTGDTIVLTDSNDEDTLEQFRSREYKIVGTVNTPVYLDYQRGSTDIGNGSLETFFFIDRDSFDTDYYTQLYLTLEGDEQPFTQEKEDRLEAAEDSMKALAEKITAARRQTAMADAQEELDEKKQEYEENLAKYEDEKAKAEREMDKAEAKLNKGQKQINSARKKAKSTQAELEKTEVDLNGQLEKAKAGIEAINSEKAKAEAGLAKANAGRAQLTEAKAGLEQQLAQAESADEPDQQLIAEIKGKIAGIDTQIAGIDQDISNINKSISSNLYFYKSRWYSILCQQIFKNLCYISRKQICFRDIYSNRHSPYTIIYPASHRTTY